ncbi:MAG: MutS protein msh4 [Sclerophora amabilis]|nr:MAG: MutS protein msh4 [Sclerophora amabilis]
MAQIGSFVPAQYASFPVFHQLFARISADDSIEANVSTFASEMREMAFILRNIEEGSMVIIDELGRGTSTRDGLAIALSIAEVLVDSKAMVWFATHFKDLAKVMSERPGVVNMHLQVEMTGSDKITMLYKIANGCVTEKHYGLALSRVVDLPPMIQEIASNVSHTLDRQSARRKRSSATMALAKRRRVIMGLYQQLLHVRDGQMEGKALTDWLKRLQNEFVNRMSSIEAEAEDDGDTDGADHQDDEMDVDRNDREQAGRGTSDSEGTVVGDDDFLPTAEGCRESERQKGRAASNGVVTNVGSVTASVPERGDAGLRDPDNSHEPSNGSSFSELVAPD